MNKLKYFFAVDTAYVAKKLGLLVFPYTHQVSWWAAFPPSSCLSLAPPPDLNPSFLSCLFLVTWLLLSLLELGSAVQSRCTFAPATRPQRP